MLDTSGGCFHGSSGDSDVGIFKRGKRAYGLAYNRALSDEEIAQKRQALESVVAGRASRCHDMALGLLGSGLKYLDIGVESGYKKPASLAAAAEGCRAPALPG